MIYKKIIIAVLVAAVTVAGTAFTPYVSYGTTAAEIQSELDEVREEIDKTKSQMSEAEQEAADAGVEKLEAEKKLAAAQEALNSTKQKIKKLNDKIDHQEKSLNARLKNMYMNDNVSFITVLLSSDSISDFLTNINLVKRIYQNDAEMLEELEVSKEKVKKVEEQQEKEEAELEEKAEEYKAKKAEMDAKVAKIKDKLDKQEAQEQRMEAAAEALNNTIADSVDSSSDNQATSGWQWPVPSASGISSYYGNRINPIYHTSEFHRGIDIPCSYGAAIVAAGSGTVITAAYHYSYGNYVVIDHGQGKTTLYAHNSSLLVSAGTKVSKGQQIAAAGSTGDSTGNHCHFEFRINSSTVNPLNYVSP